MPRQYFCYSFKLYKALEGWDNYWADLLNYGDTVIVDLDRIDTTLRTGFSASRIVYGQEVELTEDMVGKNLGIWFVGEPLNNTYNVTIQLEVVPAGTLK